ncbi:MAG TPA: hypothetical protein VFG43_09765 [Geminicoccaceae bacterium]|nr:hypothetical protein [Geminicoccaceae bacterium]
MAAPVAADEFGFGIGSHAGRSAPWQYQNEWSLGRRQPPQVVCEPGGLVCYQVERPLQGRNSDSWGRQEPRGRAWGQPWQAPWSQRRDPWDSRPAPRFARPDSNVVCDQRTSICYKNGRIDKSETREHFGNGASRRADALRDQAGTGRVFVPRPGVVCDPDDRKCIRKGLRGQ